MLAGALLAGCGSDSTSNPDPAASPAADEASETSTEEPTTEAPTPVEAEPLSVAAASFDVAYLPLHAGLHMGFFEEEGVELEIKQVGSSQNAALVSGEVDITASGISSPFGPIIEGQDVQLIGLRYQGGVIAYVAGEPSLESIEDCTSMATFSPGGGTYMWAVALKNAFGLDDLELRTSADFGAIAGLLVSGQTNCANGTPGLFAGPVSEGRAKILLDPSKGDLPEAIKDMPDSGYFALAETVEAKRDLMAAFLRAERHLTAWMLETPPMEIAEFVQDNVPEYREIETEALAEQIEANNFFLAKGGGIIDEDLYGRLLVFLQDGGLEGLDPSDPKFAYDKVVDMSMLESLESNVS